MVHDLACSIELRMHAGRWEGQKKELLEVITLRILEIQWPPRKFELFLNSRDSSS